MRIRKFNENIENDDFISIDEVKDIISHLYDYNNTTITIEEKWMSFGTEVHLSNDKEYKDDIKSISVGVDFGPKEVVPFYVEYGIDSNAIKKEDLSDVVNILNDVIDISNQLEGVGYDLHTEIISYYIKLSITKKGTLKRTNH